MLWRYINHGLTANLKVFICFLKRKLMAIDKEFNYEKNLFEINLWLYTKMTYLNERLTYEIYLHIYDITCISSFKRFIYAEVKYIHIFNNLNKSVKLKYLIEF